MLVSTISLQSAPPAIAEWLTRSQQQVDLALAKLLKRPEAPAPSTPPATDPVPRLEEAMSYAVLGGGKRIRPALVFAACEACQGNPEQALAAAKAIELLHAYTLVHDDLPAMDDDDERRGRPTVHVRYDQATAILTGDALLTLAFSELSQIGDGAGRGIAVLAARAGRHELLAGQMLDIDWQRTGHVPSFADLETMHRGKTGALFSAACELGAIAAGASEEKCKALGRYGMAIGVAFQHADDLDDGDFPQYSPRAQERRLELAKLAREELSILDKPARLLEEIAQWLGEA